MGSKLWDQFEKLRSKQIKPRAGMTVGGRPLTTRTRKWIVECHLVAYHTRPNHHVVEQQKAGEGLLSRGQDAPAGSRGARQGRLAPLIPWQQPADVQSGKLQDAIDKITLLEKQTRNVGFQSPRRVMQAHRRLPI